MSVAAVAPSVLPRALGGGSRSVRLSRKQSAHVHGSAPHC